MASIASNLPCISTTLRTSAPLPGLKDTLRAADEDLYEYSARKEARYHRLCTVNLLAEELEDFKTAKATIRALMECYSTQVTRKEYAGRRPRILPCANTLAMWYNATDYE